MNDNYKLLAELSNENLRLTSDKLRAEDALTTAKREERRLREEMRRIVGGANQEQHLQTGGRGEQAFVC